MSYHLNQTNQTVCTGTYYDETREDTSISTIILRSSKWELISQGIKKIIVKRWFILHIYSKMILVNRNVEHLYQLR